MAIKRKQLVAVTKLAVQLHHQLQSEHIHTDVILLFGSVAKGRDHDQSDIDLCVVSRDYGKNRLMENAKTNLIASRIDSRIEVITASLDDYLSLTTVSSILAEIKKTGICLL